VDKIAIATPGLSHLLFINHRKVSKSTIPKDVKGPSPDTICLIKILLFCFYDKIEIPKI
jgi:hypothetical protein